MKRLSVYNLSDSQFLQKGKRDFEPSSGGNQHVAIALGSLTNRSLRIGTPSHRVEREVVDIIAIINRPPTQTGLNADDKLRTYSSYENKQDEKTEMFIKHTHKLGVDITNGFDFVILKSSVTATYGENFEKTTKKIKEEKFGKSVIANLDDALVYTITDYDIWEYPIYENNNGVPISYIIVIFPQPINEPYTVFDSISGASCNSWYQPTHQRNNVLSYPVLDSPNHLDEYSLANSLFENYVQFGGNGSSAFFEWSELQEVSQSNTINKEGRFYHKEKENLRKRRLLDRLGSDSNPI